MPADKPNINPSSMSPNTIILSAYNGIIKCTPDPTTPRRLSIFTRKAADKGVEVVKMNRSYVNKCIADDALEFLQHEIENLGEDIRFRAGTYKILFLPRIRPKQDKDGNHVDVFPELGFPEDCMPPGDQNILKATGDGDGDTGVVVFFGGKQHEDAELLPDDYNDKFPEVIEHDAGEPVLSGAEIPGGVNEPLKKPTASKDGEDGDEIVGPEPTDKKKSKKNKKQSKASKKLNAEILPGLEQLLAKVVAEGVRPEATSVGAASEKPKGAEKVEQDKAEKMKLLVKIFKLEDPTSTEPAQKEQVDIAEKGFYKEKAMIQKIATTNLHSDVNTTQRDYWKYAFVDMFPDMSLLECLSRVTAMEAHDATQNNQTAWDAKWHSYTHVRDAMNCKLNPKVWMPILLALSTGSERFRDVPSEIRSTADMDSVTTKLKSSVAAHATTPSGAHPTSVLLQSSPNGDASPTNMFSKVKDAVSSPKDTSLKPKTIKKSHRQVTFGKNMDLAPTAVAQITFPFSKDTFDFNVPPPPPMQNSLPAESGPSLIFGDASKVVGLPLADNVFARAALHRPGSEFVGFASGQPTASAPYVFGADSSSPPPPAKTDEELDRSGQKSLPGFEVPTSFVMPDGQVSGPSLPEATPVKEPVASSEKAQEATAVTLSPGETHENDVFALTGSVKEDADQTYFDPEEDGLSEMSEESLGEMILRDFLAEEDAPVEEDILDAETVSSSDSLDIDIDGLLDELFEDTCAPIPSGFYEYLARCDYEVNDVEEGLYVSEDELPLDLKYVNRAEDPITLPTPPTSPISSTSAIAASAQTGVLEGFSLKEPRYMSIDEIVNTTSIDPDCEPHSSSVQILSAGLGSNDTQTISPIPDPVANKGTINGLALETWSRLQGFGDEQGDSNTFDERLKKLIDGLQQLQADATTAQPDIGSSDEPSLEGVDAEILTATLYLDEHFNNDKEVHVEDSKLPSLGPLEDLEVWAHATFDNAFGSPPQLPALQSDQTDLHKLFEQEPLFQFLHTSSDGADQSTEQLHASTSVADKSGNHESTRLEQLEHMTVADLMVDTGDAAQAPKNVTAIVGGYVTEQKAAPHLRISTTATVPVGHFFDRIGNHPAFRLGEHTPPHTPMSEHAMVSSPAFYINHTHANALQSTPLSSNAATQTPPYLGVSDHIGLYDPLQPLDKKLTMSSAALPTRPSQ
ncbi:hypothetical protein N0V83_003521 [Neocucurbitaria cava]|uniref:Uncharacterized protein n=1 Tax=Neocucurbitaria cava TaxID=798079 RepID=A0A9W9CNQ9_9PLEO|nr:hypothetical protein N0V83_003521 [Neocucurbitaria cava]